MRAVNLIPAEQRRGAGGAYGRSEGAAYVILGLLAGIVVLAGVYAMSRSQVSDRRDQAARLSAQASTAQAQAASLSAYVSFLSLRDQRVSTVAQLAGSRFDWPHAFHELGRVLPNDVSLSSVKGSIAGGAPAVPVAPPPPPPAAGPAGSPAGATAAATSPASSSTPAGSTPSLALSGCTVSQSEVAFMLNRLRLIDGVSAVNLQSATESSATTGAPGTSGSCPVAFQVTVGFNPLPAVATTTPSASTPGTAVAAAPAAAPTPSTVPAAATTGAK